MSTFTPHPRDFICIRENENALGPSNLLGAYKVPAGKIFVPTAIGSIAWVDSTTGGYTPGQAWCVWAGVVYPGDPDYNSQNHIAQAEGYCGVFGPMSNTFQAVGKFRSGLCTMAAIPFGVYYREGTELYLEGGPKMDESAEFQPPGTPPEETDVRMYGFLCDM